jgi:hypothetical protein
VWNQTFPFNVHVGDGGITDDASACPVTPPSPTWKVEGECLTTHTYADVDDLGLQHFSAADTNNSWFPVPHECLSHLRSTLHTYRNVSQQTEPASSMLVCSCCSAAATAHHDSYISCTLHPQRPPTLSSTTSRLPLTQQCCMYTCHPCIQSQALA